ncbi:MAG: hypothetical protein JW854_01780 [Actinobacteria bacterium]|nr:hypothetical protein [Actinomycetota bacterium]
MNFFAQQLNDYFLESGRQLPPEVLAVLGKPLKGLNASDIDAYNRLIGPYQDKIRAALLDRFKRQGSPVREWSQQVNPYYRPLVEEFAAQILGMESTPRLPAALAVRTVYAEPKERRQAFLNRLSLPRLSYKWAIAVVVVVALLAGGGWWLFAATAPSRMLHKVKGEVERGEYALALQHMEEMEERYPDKEQTEEALDIKPWAALGYADELVERAQYEEAVFYYDIAENESELEDEALLKCANAYAAWAAALQGAGAHADCFECCEAALVCALEGFDTGPVMDLRAQALFSWGEAFLGQGDYCAAAERFEKCYREWPAGSLANTALEKYVDMTVAFYTESPPPGKSPTAGGNVKVNMINPTEYTWRFFFSGPSTMCFDLAPHETRTIYILPGIYNDVGIIESLFIYSSATADDFSEPTGAYSWWDVTLPFPEDVAPQGVAYEDIMSRLEELQASLPPEILESIEDVQYQPLSGGGALGDSMAEYDPNEDTIYFDAAFITPGELDGTIFHEWGHAYSDHELDAEEKAAYMELRDISSDIPWDNWEYYYLSVEEDFAEVFAVVFGNAPWEDYTWYGPVNEVEALREMILAAAD